MTTPTDQSPAHAQIEVARIGFRQAIVVGLIGIATAVVSHYLTLNIKSTKTKAPALDVYHCPVSYQGTECGRVANNVIKQSTEELSATATHAALGNKGEYKLGITCINVAEAPNGGALSSLVFIVSGPSLLEARKLSAQLRGEFLSQVSSQPLQAAVQRCITKL